ncbi:MAG TPA: glycosyltransferase [Candidatus Woesebacteria bacterium]|nr:glycosyltransferase [Candidatus Woesebacteria bacterium]
MEKIDLLSLVVPTYRQEKTIVKNIQALQDMLDLLLIPYEIIVVIDGQVDKTYEEVNKIKNKKIRIISYKENLGKGNAVRTGMLQAKGDVIGFIDAGMEIDPTGISMLLNHMIWYDADIVVGSKLHPVSQVEYPPFRKMLSWGYRSLNRVLFGLKVKDTQVGIKLYKRKVVKKVFPKLLVKQFAFDVETLAVAHALGFTRIYDAPIKLKFGKESSIKNTKYWIVVWSMLLDTAAVFYRVRVKKYYQNLK